MRLDESDVIPLVLGILAIVVPLSVPMFLRVWRLMCDEREDRSAANDPDLRM